MNELERFLSRSQVVVGRRISGGILSAVATFGEDSKEILVKDADNRRTYAARDCVPLGTDLNREMAAYELSRIIPLVRLPSMVMRSVSISEKQTRVVVMEKIVHERKSIRRSFQYPTGTSVTIKRNLALWDAIVGNTDRHYLNWLQDIKNGEIVAIDHGLCFPVPATYIDIGSTDWLRNESMPKWCLSWLQKVLSRWDKIENKLGNLLEPEALTETKARVAYMLKTQRFISDRQLSRRVYTEGL